MPLTTVPQFVETLRELGILTEAQWQQLEPKLAGHSDLRTLGRELITLGWLSPYQVNRLVQSRGAELVLGHYVLIEQLGEGGMGTVFKARHRILNRLAALKIIRKEMLADADAVKRFRREMEAVARLRHPNVVLAYDADHVQGQHFLAMELVDGINLAAMVKKQGPLAIENACDFLRQAALGLQHAHEHGLVHRDIKPSNLLFSSKEGLIKVLDLGLARLHQEDGQAITAITQAGIVMGTPDFMAPEQATNPHQVDIRADIYSLGATLFFLLTGKPPFPGGTLEQKLSWHLHAQPPILEKVRPDAPPGLTAVALRMLAKKPDDRYATPAEVALALEPFCSNANALAARTVSMPGAAQAAPCGPSTTSLPDAPTRNPSITNPGTEPLTLPSALPVRRGVRKPLVLGALAALGLSALTVLLVVLLPGPDVNAPLAKKDEEPPPTKDKDKEADKDKKDKIEKKPPALLVEAAPRVFFHLGPNKQPGFWILGEQEKKIPLTYDLWGLKPQRSTTNTLAAIGNRIVEFGDLRDGKWELAEEKLPSAGDWPRIGTRSVWTCEKLRITQVVEVIPSRNTLTRDDKPHHLLDTCLVQYRLENLDTKPLKLGLRCYLDVMISENDRPFFLNAAGDILSDPYDAAAPEKIPAAWKALEWKNAFQPGWTAFLTLKLGAPHEWPTRVCLASEADIRIWEVPLREPASGKKSIDSAVVIYWDSRDVGPGSYRTVAYSYGLGVPRELDPGVETEVQQLLAGR